ALANTRIWVCRIAAGTFALGRYIVAHRTITCTFTNAIGILSPQQKLNRMITGGDIGLTTTNLIHLSQQVRRNGASILLDATNRDALAIDNIVLTVIFTLITVTDIVNQSFI